MAKIIFDLEVGAPARLEVDGVTGGRCAELSKPFEERIGNVEETEQKPEWVESLDSLKIEVHE